MNKRVLIVTPDQEVSHQMRERLESSGYDLLIERTGLSGLETARQFKPDTIYVEANITDLNGFQFCRILKDSGPYHHIPVVVMGDSSTTNERLWAQQAGADAYLVRPYAADDLLKMTDTLTSSGSKR